MGSRKTERESAERFGKLCWAHRTLSSATSWRPPLRQSRRNRRRKSGKWLGRHVNTVSMYLGDQKITASLHGCGQTWSKRTRACRNHHSDKSPCFYRRKTLLAPLFGTPTEDNMNGLRTRRLYGRHDNGEVVLCENGEALTVPEFEALPDGWWRQVFRVFE
jgi:hypothetical protein